MWEAVFPNHLVSQKSLERTGEDAREQKAQTVGVFLHYKVQRAALGTAKHPASKHLQTGIWQLLQGSLDDPRHWAIGTSSTCHEGTDVAH